MFHLQGNRGLSLALFLLVFSIYLATYSGRVDSGDSFLVADATSSLVHFNDMQHDEGVWYSPRLDPNPNQQYPFTSFDANESLIVYVSALLLRVAELFPDLGFIHTLWLLNAILVALSVVLFFLYARILGYEENVAVLGSLCFGLATIVWPYSKTLFREPLAMLLLLLIALCLEKWRMNYRHFLWFIVAVLFAILAFLTKNSTAFAIPALIALALPNLNRPRWGDILLGLAFVFLLYLVFVPHSFRLVSMLFKPIIKLNGSFAQSALNAYLFSIGGSLWATSPILLIGIVGFWQSKRRLIYAVFLMVFTYAFAHAVLTEQHWFGGLSWPPRFLVPVVPFAALLLLPVLQWLMQPNRIMWRILAILLLLYSIGIQVIASISWQDAYVSLLPEESGGLVEWAGGLNDWRYLRWLLLPQSWESLGLQLAWTRSDAVYFIWIFLGMSLIALVLLWQKRFRWLLWVLLIANLVVLNFGLRHLYWHDPEYWANKPALFEALAILQTESDGEPLFLAGGADVTYERFIMNYNREHQFRPVVLGFQKGEATSNVAAAEVPFDDNITDLFDWDIPRIVDFIANRHERFWWLAHNSEFTPWAVRVEERYFAENYYLLREFPSSDPLVRLQEYSSVRAPHPYDFRLPEYLSDLRFGEHIRLYGFTLPLGTEYQAGDDVPISFYWQSDELLDTDYTISWFIVSETGAYSNLQGIDSRPSGGFAPTTGWVINQFVIDNRARELPTDLPAGNYQIWLRIYPTGTNGETPLPITEGEVIDGVLGVLPITLSIR